MTTALRHLIVAVPLVVLLAGVVGAGAARAAPAPVTYVALGDSTGVGVGAREGGYVARLFGELTVARPGSRLVNLCRSGATTARVLSDQVPRLEGQPVGLVTVGVGVNDLSRRVPPELFRERLEAIAAGIRARTTAPVVVTNLPEVSLAPAIPFYARPFLARQVEAFNAIIADVARRHGWNLVDIHGVSRKELPAHPEFFSADGFHPSDAGYRFWSTVMWPVARAALSPPPARGRSAAPCASPHCGS